MTLTIPGLVPEHSSQSVLAVYAEDGIGEFQEQADGTYKYLVDGEAVTGWQDIEYSAGKTARYYFGTDGVMQTGWKTIDGKRYYFGAAENDGKMKTGWQNIERASGKTYKHYFGTNGVLNTGWKTIGGKRYYFGASATDGRMKTGWSNIERADGKKYRHYFGTNGVMRTGWKTISGKKYYFGTSATDGKARTGWQRLKYKGKYYWYSFDTKGKMRTGRQKISGNWYYFGSKSDGKLKKGRYKVNGKYYTFTNSKPQNLVFAKSTASVRQGETITLKFKATAVSVKGVKWTSSNKKIATVSSKGIVTAKSAGFVNIKATKSGKSVTCKVKVIPLIKASAISVSPTTLSLYVGNSKSLSYSLTTPAGAPVETNEAVTWSSSNKAVATVNSAGLVTGKKSGMVTITAKTESGLAASATVTVMTIEVEQSTVQLTQGTQMYAPINIYGAEVKYKSSKTSVATVNANTGFITASQTNTGSAKITATTSEGDAVSITVKVVDYPTIIDVSTWQGTIDWSKASKVVDLAILRVSYGDNKKSATELYERKYPEYSTACEKYDVPFGVYSFAQYKTKKQAENEAKIFYETATAGGREPAFYVVDCEVDYITRANTEAYIAKLRSLAGERIKVGVYVGHHLYEELNLNLTRDTDNPKTPDFVWIPRYSYDNNGSISNVPAPKFKCDMWQYSSGGYIPGINGKVDMNTIVTADGKALSTTWTSYPTFLKWLRTPA
jgi:glucan-binding YG repeat protein/GH25 family lysozyme M1 (1,4-beta-N-acetylmuramidase)